MLALACSIRVFRALRDPLLDERNFFFGQKVTPRRHDTIVIFGEFNPFDQQAPRGVAGKNGPPIFIALREGLSNGRKPKSTFFLFGAVARDTPCFKDGFDLGE